MNNISSYITLNSNVQLQDKTTANQTLQEILLKTWESEKKVFTQLYVANTQVSGSALCLFTNTTEVLKKPLRKLQVLDLSNTNASTTMFHNLHQFPNLETVVLNNCKNMDLDGLPVENKKVSLPKKLQTLSIVGTKISSICLDQILKHIPSLQTLHCTLDLQGHGKQVVVLTRTKSSWNVTFDGKRCNTLVSQNEPFYSTLNPVSPYEILEAALKRQGDLEKIK
ncbi:MAG: hypothetical protein LLF94_08610 [Chlamydiales bacterium]|nr:hypothetical protein [Chlamydiales bacterium]